MLFNSLTFIAFLTVVLSVHYSPLRWREKKIFLLVASYVFYAAWNPPFVALIWISTFIDWHVARFIATSSRPHVKKGWLLVSLGANLGLLGFFKYGQFLLDNFVRAAGLLGIDFAPADPGIILPVGISFYTFQTLSYTIDVYRGSLRPSRSFVDFALFVTFFPQLVAGPIVRAAKFLPQLANPPRATWGQFSWGLTLLVLGLFQKIVLADAWMAPVADAVYGAADSAGFVTAWLGTLAFSSQIFFDFAGYSTCAIGVALCMGLELPDNFRFPYGAIGLSDFWSRWHISLSSWLRDYLYIPLGGNRRGARRTQINLMLTMLLGGLWHGAAWRFVAWGGLHGFYLIAERRILPQGAATRPLSRFRTMAAIVRTYVLVLLTWVFFRAESFADAVLLFRAMLGVGGGGLILDRRQPPLVLVLTLAVVSAHAYLRERTLEDLWARWGGVTRGIIIAGMLLMILMTPGQDRAFIYFQF